MKMFRSDEEAVSPVIGVILMVAIVVILAAVIAAFVFGMAGSTGTSKNVGMTVTLDSTGHILSILWQGGSDINSLTQIAATATANDGSFNETQTNTDGSYTVGSITDLTFTNDIPGSRVVMVGTFSDGSNQVLFDRRY